METSNWPVDRVTVRVKGCTTEHRASAEPGNDSPGTGLRFHTPLLVTLTDPAWQPPCLSLHYTRGESRVPRAGTCRVRSWLDTRLALPPPELSVSPSWMPSNSIPLQVSAHRRHPLTSDPPSWGPRLLPVSPNDSVPFCLCPTMPEAPSEQGLRLCSPLHPVRPTDEHTTPWTRCKTR